MQKTLLFLTAFAAGLAFGETTELRRGEFTISYTTCPKCPMRARFAPDGKHAFLNTSRVAEKDRAALSERLFDLMAKAADTRKGGMKRPLMGWSSWNTFGLDISEDIILSVAQAMATNGLKAAGYTYVNIDDGFFNGHDEKTGILKWNYKRFPNGMKPVVDGIHALGLKAGTYSDAGADTCGSNGGDKGGFGSGLYGHDAADCKLHFIDLGFDFIKVDYCGGRKLKLDERQRYTEISKAIRATGRKDVRFNICRWAFPGTWAADIAESWRTTGDIRANWKSVRGLIRENLYLSAYAKPGHYNDLDMLQVGRYVGQVKNAYAKSDTGLTPEEEATHFGMWCMLSSPLLIGCDVRNIPMTTLELVTNPYLLALNQNDLGQPGYVVCRSGEAYVLVKDADTRFGTARFLALYNAEDKPHDFNVAFSSLDLGGKVEVMDLGERADLGAFEDAFAMTVPAHGARFYRLDAEKRLDRTVYEAETAYLSEYQELRNAAKAGTAFPADIAGASNGVAVRFLGNRETNDLVWKDVKISKDGTYKLEFRCCKGEARAFDVQVDGGQKLRLEFNGTDPVVTEVALKAGVHAVRISNATAWCPDVDMMRVIRVSSDARKTLDVSKPVTFSSLLDELVDRDAVTRMPAPAYTVRSWSSYERTSVKPGNDTWFANQDWNNFIRKEGREQVMVDAKGPGAVVRMWCAGVNIAKGLVRIYLDGSPTPAFSGTSFDLMGGSAICGAPFSFVCAVNAGAPEQCGRNLMLPIPYAKSCRITYEPASSNSRFWYNVETRTYEDGIAVETLTPAVFAACSNRLAAAAADLLSDPKDATPPVAFDGTIALGRILVRSVKDLRGAAVRRMAMRVTGKDVLERVVVEFDFDGRRAISLPLGAFFGAGPWGLSPYRTRLCAVRDSGLMECRLVMPVRSQYELRIVNGTDAPVTISESALVVGDYAWQENRSMHLTAEYVRRRGMASARAGHDFDMSFDDVRGRGLLVGTSVFVVNPSTRKGCPWWGEGDEKIWVDGEGFPSIFGTGTEDYFNYAWSRPEAFSQPFCAQPIGAGNLAPGRSVNLRWRALDAIPFEMSLKFDMEMVHWDKQVAVDYDSVSWRYLRP